MARFLLLAFLTLRLLGGDLALLQVVAWTGMLLTRAPEQGLATAVETTFDGDHPCPLCHAVEESREADGKKRQETPAGTVAKLELKHMSRTEEIRLPALAVCDLPAPPRMFLTVAHAVSRSDAPPVPPPRLG